MAEVARGWGGNPAISADFRKWSADRETASNIVALMWDVYGIQTTRNAVLGFAFRQGLSIGGGKPGRPARPRVAKSVAIPEPKPEAKNPAHFVRRLPRAKTVVKTEPEPVVDAVHTSEGKFFDLFPIAGRGLVLPSWATCRWIDGDPRTPSAKMCAEQRVGESSWCARHKIKAFAA
jgi:hypothetical protein